MKGDKLNFEVSEASGWSSDVVELGRGRDRSAPQMAALPGGLPAAETGQRLLPLKSNPSPRQQHCCPQPAGPGWGARVRTGLTLETLCPNASPPGGPSSGRGKADEPASWAELPAMQWCGGLRARAARRAHPRVGPSASDFAVCLGHDLSFLSPFLPPQRWPGSAGLSGGCWAVPCARTHWREGTWSCWNPLTPSRLTLLLTVTTPDGAISHNTHPQTECCFLAAKAKQTQQKQTQRPHNSMVFLTSVPSQRQENRQEVLYQLCRLGPPNGGGDPLPQGFFPSSLAEYLVVKSLSGQDPCTGTGSHLLISHVSSCHHRMYW